MIPLSLVQYAKGTRINLWEYIGIEVPPNKVNCYLLHYQVLHSTFHKPGERQKTTVEKINPALPILRNMPLFP